MPRVREAEQWVIDANSKVIGRAFVANSDLIKVETIKGGSGRFARARGTWATDKFYTAQKCHAASLLLRERFGLFGEVNGARPSIIDGSFCEKKRTKVIQIAATLDNERRDRRVNFHAIYDCIRAYYRIGRNHISRILLESSTFQFYVTRLNFCISSSEKKRCKSEISRMGRVLFKK